MIHEELSANEEEEELSTDEESPWEEMAKALHRYVLKIEKEQEEKDKKKDKGNKKDKSRKQLAKKGQVAKKLPVKKPKKQRVNTDFDAMNPNENEKLFASANIEYFLQNHEDKEKDVEMSARIFCSGSSQISAASYLMLCDSKSGTCNG